MVRELGAFERALTRSGLYAPFNVVSVARIEGRLAPETLRAALEHVQRRHAFLRVRIQPARGRFFFADAGSVEIPLEIIPRRRDDEWLAVVEAEFSRPIDSAEGPLLRCSFLPPREDRRGEIILTHHHTIMDGVAIVGLWRELLEACAQIQAGAPPSAGAGEAPIPPAEESLFPPSYRGWRGDLRLLRFGLGQFWDEVLFNLRMLGRPVPKVRNGAKGKAFSITFDDTQTSAIAYRCRREGITLNSALNAAMLLAVNRRLYRGQSLLMRTFSFADLRPSLAAAPPLEQLGCFISMLRYTVPVTNAMDFWELARLLHQRIYHSLKSGDKFSAARLAETLIRMMVGTRMFRYGNTALSYSGLTDLGTGYGGLRLLGLHGFIAGFDLGPEFSANVNLFKDRLIWDFVYLDTDMDGATAREISEEIRGILTTAIA